MNTPVCDPCYHGSKPTHRKLSAATENVRVRSDKRRARNVAVCDEHRKLVDALVNQAAANGVAKKPAKKPRAARAEFKCRTAGCARTFPTVRGRDRHETLGHRQRRMIGRGENGRAAHHV